MGKADSWEMVASVVAILLGLVACASATGVQILAEDGQSSYAGMQDELKDAWKQRDEALAQVKEMEKALTSKCGAEAGANAAGAAKLAAKKEMVRKEEGIVKKEQSVARRDAQIADAAMGQAQAAAKVKNQLSDQVKKATLEMKMLQNMAKLAGKKVEQDKAAAVKADKGSTGVKAASAKESVDYGKAQDAQMKAAAAEKKVSGLQARLAAEGGVAEVKLNAAKKDTQNAAAKVNTAMKAQADSAQKQQEVAQERVRIVQTEESQLKKEDEELHRKMVAAQLKTKRAMVAVARAKSSAENALSGAKVPPSDKGAVVAAQQQVVTEMSAGSGQKSSYATTIKNIEATLIKSKNKIHDAAREKKKLEKKLSKVDADLSTEQDIIQKTKLKKQKQSIEGNIQFQDSRAKAATKVHAKQEKKQKDAIRSVISSVIMDEPTETAKQTGQDDVVRIAE